MRLSLYVMTVILWVSFLIDGSQNITGYYIMVYIYTILYFFVVFYSQYLLHVCIWLTGMPTTLKVPIHIRAKLAKSTNFSKTGWLSYVYWGLPTGNVDQAFWISTPYPFILRGDKPRSLAAAYSLLPIEKTCILYRADCDWTSIGIKCMANFNVTSVSIFIHLLSSSSTSE